MTPLNGSIVLQSRVLPDALAIAGVSRGPQARLPNTQELSRFLSLLGTLALSSSLRYDPTSPQRYVGPSLDAARTLGISNIHPLATTAGEELVAEVVVAYSMAVDYIHHELLVGARSAGERPLSDEECKLFQTYLAQMVACTTRDDRTALGHEAIGREVTGGKLLLAIAGYGADEVALVLQALATQPPKAVISTMINIFRPFLLTSWAGKQGSIVSADPDAVTRIQDHQRALWDAIEQELKRDAKVAVPSYAKSSFDAPMLGALVLMSAECSSRPEDLILQAANATSSDPHLAELSKLFWNLPVVGSHRDADQVVEEITRSLMERILSRSCSLKETDFKALLSRAATAVVPAISVSAATAAACILVNADGVREQLAGFAMGALTTALFFIAREGRIKDPPAAAVSTALKQFDKFAPLLEKKVELVWSKPFVAVG